jgi:hypothetical protein
VGLGENKLVHFIVVVIMHTTSFGKGDPCAFRRACMRVRDQVRLMICQQCGKKLRKGNGNRNKERQWQEESVRYGLGRSVSRNYVKGKETETMKGNGKSLCVTDSAVLSQYNREESTDRDSIRQSSCSWKPVLAMVDRRTTGGVRRRVSNVVCDDVEIDRRGLRAV